MVRIIFIFILTLANTVNAKNYDGILNLYLYPHCEGDKAVDFSVCALREEIAQNLIYQNNIYTIFDSKFDYPTVSNFDNFSYENNFNFICNSNKNLKQTLDENKYIRLRVENPDDPFFRVVFRLKYDPKKVVEKFEKDKGVICSLKKQMQVQEYWKQQEELRWQKQKVIDSARAASDYEKKEKQELIFMFFVWAGFAIFIIWVGLVTLKLIIDFFKGVSKKAPEVINKIDLAAKSAKEKVVESIKNNETIREVYLHLKKKDSNELMLPEEIVSLLAKLACSDGKISQEEKEEVSAVIMTMLDAMKKTGLSSDLVNEQKDKLFHIANSAKFDNKPISYFCQNLSVASDEIKIGAFMQFTAFSAIDGFSEKTLFVLREIGYNLGLEDSFIDIAISTFSFKQEAENEDTSIYDPYEILGCHRSDSLATIKAAHRRLVRRYHPDFLHGKQMSDEEIREATMMLQEINAAFDEIKKEKRD